MTIESPNIAGQFLEPLTSKSRAASLYNALIGLLESIAAPTAILESSLSLLACNKAFENLFELRLDFSGQLSESAHWLSLLDSIQNKPQTGAFFELQLTTAQGPLSFLGSLKPFNICESKAPGLILTLADLSALNIDDPSGSFSNLPLAEGVRQMRQYAQEADAANKAKSEFLTNMSHEIRTPLNGVLGMINLLLDTGLDEQQRRYAETSKSSGEALLGLLNDILDFSKIESGHLDLENITFSLDCVLEDVAEIISHRLMSKRLRLVYFLERGCPVMVEGDLGRVRQILVNLAGNAVKFTPQGSITITVGLESESSDGYLLLFQVADTGIGIPQDKVDRLFSPFSQIDASTTRKYGGTGLGLSICKRLVTLMGGNIGVISTQGEGSTFWFTIRLGKPKKQQVLPQLLKGRVLLVALDDEQIMPRVILNSLGLAVTDAGNLEEALALIDVGFDYIMVDSELGHEVVQGMANSVLAKSSQTTLMLLSPAMKSQDEVNFLKKSGYTHLLIKPLKKSELLSALTGEAAVCECSPATNNSANMELDATHYKLLLVDDNQVNQMVALGLLKKMGYDADVAANGQEAVAALAQIHYDLVLMDCQMPVMDGYEATALIRCGESPALDMSVPIIAMTANAMEGDKEKCLNVGMNDYISKPIIPAQMQKVLKKWLRKNDDPVPAPKKTKLRPAWERFAKTRKNV